MVVGIFISFLPDFFGVNRSSFGSPLWSLTFLMGQLPNALIYVLQERIFGRVNLDTWYVAFVGGTVSTWGCFSQIEPPVAVECVALPILYSCAPRYMLAKMYQWTIIFIIVLLPVNAIPNFGSADGISGVLRSTCHYFWFLCLNGLFPSHIHF